MNEELRISIPKACHEKWSKMSPNKQGRFCSICKKNVFDFTKTSDLEIINTLNENKNLCGRFNNSQLNRNLAVIKQKKYFWINTAASLITFFGLGNYSAKAQGTPMLSEARKYITYSPKKLNTSDPVSLTDKLNEEQICSGVVHDKNNIPLSNVLVANTRLRLLVTTDSNGNFSIPFEKNDDNIVCFDKLYILNEDAIISFTTKRDKKREEEEEEEEN